MQRRIPITPQPKQADTKSVLRWAFPLPHKIGSTILWAERYEVIYMWEEREVLANIEGKAVKYIVGNWIKIVEGALNGK